MGSTALEITPTLSIPDDELVERFVRASGAGGQNVNKVATAVELRFDVAGSPSLPDALRERLKQLLPECFGIEDCPVELALCQDGDPA